MNVPNVNSATCAYANLSKPNNLKKNIYIYRVSLCTNVSNQMDLRDMKAY